MIDFCTSSLTLKHTFQGPAKQHINTNQWEGVGNDSSRSDQLHYRTQQSLSLITTQIIYYESHLGSVGSIYDICEYKQVARLLSLSNVIFFHFIGVRGIDRCDSSLKRVELWS